MLALIVFSGGTEARITGALLLGFGFGWVLMATPIMRHTRQPQSWAVVPAVAMGATGAALPDGPDPVRRPQHIVSGNVPV